MERKFRKQHEGISTEDAYNFAEQKAKEGKWKEAIFLYKETLRLQKNEYGNADRRVARTLNDIGVAMSNLNGEKNHVEALRFFREALVLQQKILPSDKQEMAVTATNMTLLMDHMKRVSCAKGEIHFTPSDGNMV